MEVLAVLEMEDGMNEVVERFCSACQHLSPESGARNVATLVVVVLTLLYIVE